MIRDSPHNTRVMHSNRDSTETPIGDDRGKTHSTKHSTDDGGGDSGSGDDGGDTDTGAGVDTHSLIVVVMVVVVVNVLNLILILILVMINYFSALRSRVIDKSNNNKH